MHYLQEPNDDDPTFPCGICGKNISKNNKAIKCDICNNKIHIKCNKSGETHYKEINKSNGTCICLKCTDENMPFSKLTDHQFYFFFFFFYANHPLQGFRSQCSVRGYYSLLVATAGAEATTRTGRQHTHARTHTHSTPNSTLYYLQT